MISKRVNELFRESFTECCRLRDEIPAVDESNENEKNRASITKNNIHSAQLAGQIIGARDGGSLLLALIGLRSLTESLITTKYAFTHPKHAGDIQWTYDVCKDYFDRGNNLAAIKARLNEDSIAQRAKDSGADDIYNKTFAGLCNYSHVLVHSSLLNDSKRFEDFTRNSYAVVLTTLHDVREHVQTHFGIKGWQKHEDRLVEFQKQYFTE